MPGETHHSYQNLASASGKLPDGTAVWWSDQILTLGNQTAGFES
jgi:hypothetical protein